MLDAALSHPDTWRPFVTALRRGAPAGSREIEFRGTISRRSFGGSTCYDGDPSIRAPGSDSDDGPMDALLPLARMAGDRDVAIRAVVTGAGDANVSVLPGGPQVTFGVSEVLETVILVPGKDPEPYRRQPVRHDTVTVSAAADADAVTALVRRCLPDARPAGPAELAAVEAQLGLALPDDVRALYLAAGAGDLVLTPEDPDLFYGMRIVPLLDSAARAYLQPHMRYGSWRYGAAEVVPADPHGRVQQLATSPAWFAVGTDWGGNLLVVDLAPGPHGHIGQVLYVDHETNSGARWMAPSLTELLVGRPDDTAPSGAEGDLRVRVGPHTSQTLTDVQPETEVLFVYPAPEPVDLSPLAGHGRLRTVVTESTAVSSLDVLAGLPALEFLELDVAGWQQLRGTGHLPPSLIAAGFHGSAPWSATIEMANSLLTAHNQPPIEVINVPVTTI